MTRLFVTGSESFIGREFVRSARAAGNAVITFDALAAPGVDHIQGDIRDRHFADWIPTGTDAIVHLAAVSRDADCRNAPHQAFDINILGTQNVLEAAAERGVGQVVFASSEWVYGEVDNDAVQVETQAIDVTRVLGEYALSKIAGERLVAMAVARGLRAGTVLRFGIVYGPRTANWSAVESIFAKTATVDEITVGSGATARRFIHVADIASGILASVGRSGYEIFNLSGDVLVQLRELARTGADVHGRTVRIVESEPLRASVRNPDNAHAKAVLAWRPVYDLRRGLESLAGALGLPAAEPVLL